MARIAVVGIGYVGLPVVCLAAKKGFRPIALDTNESLISGLKNGKSHIKELTVEVQTYANLITPTTQYRDIQDAEVIIVAVPTPIDPSSRPDLSILESVCSSIAKVLLKGQLIIIESTIAPTTCDEIVIPLLEESSLVVNEDFYVAHCPERIDPGKSPWSSGWNLENTPRVIGASSEKGLQRAIDFYKVLLTAPLHSMKSLSSAEAVKVVENSFRDLNIAFVNELAQSCDVLGIDVMDVIKGASTKPFAFMPHYPSSGVGGHCIGVDPYYLIEKAKGAGFIHKFLTLAREINNNMPRYTIHKLTKALNTIEKSVKGTSITVLGVTYKGNVEDYRESPALKIITILKSLGAEVKIYDPYVPSLSNVNSLTEALKSICVVIGADHKEFIDISIEQYVDAGVKVIVDGKNCLDKSLFDSTQIVYTGIGR